MASFLIPLKPEQQTFDIKLNDKTYIIRLLYNKTMQTWVLDMFDESNQPMIMGHPLVTGTNILEQYRYLGLQGSFIVYTEGEPDILPSLDGLGIETKLYYVEYSE